MIGLLELRRRKLQFGLITLVVALISYLVLMINGLGIGLNVQAGSALRNFDADGIAYSDKAGLSVIRSEVSTETVQAVANANAPDATAPVGYVAVNYRKADGAVRSAAFFGYQPGTIGEPPVVDGRSIDAANGREILADRTFLEYAGFEVGDTLTITVRLAAHEFTIVGEIDEGAFFFQPALYVTLDTWRELKYGSPSPGQPEASVVLVKGRSLVGESGPGFEVVDKATAFSNIEGVEGQDATVLALRMFGYIIGGLVIAVFFYVITLQKIAHIGVLKAVGASTGFVFWQLLVQVLAITIVAAVFSVPLAWLTDRALREVPDQVPIAFTTRTYVYTIAGLFLVAVLGTLVSGRQVMKVDPIIALGQQQ